jgi:hypothetical protein
MDVSIGFVFNDLRNEVSPGVNATELDGIIDCRIPVPLLSFFISNIWRVSPVCVWQVVWMKLDLAGWNDLALNTSNGFERKINQPPN